MLSNERSVRSAAMKNPHDIDVEVAFELCGGDCPQWTDGVKDASVVDPNVDRTELFKNLESKIFHSRAVGNVDLLSQDCGARG